MNRGTGILRSMLLVFNWPHFNRIPPTSLYPTSRKHRPDSSRYIKHSNKIPNDTRPICDRPNVSVAYLCDDDVIHDDNIIFMLFTCLINFIYIAYCW
nr:unnamed protein product [Haemonchus contortus]